MVVLRVFGALTFVLGVALLALDAANSIKLDQLVATSIDKFWTNIGGDAIFQLRLYVDDWLGPFGEEILQLPASFVAFGLGMALLIFADGAQRERQQKPVLF